MCHCFDVVKWICCIQREEMSAGTSGWCWWSCTWTCLLKLTFKTVAWRCQMRGDVSMRNLQRWKRNSRIVFMLQKTLWKFQLALLRRVHSSLAEMCSHLLLPLMKRLLCLRRRCALQRRQYLLWPLKCVNCGRQTLKSPYRCFSASRLPRNTYVCEIWCNIFFTRPLNY